MICARDFQAAENPIRGARKFVRAAGNGKCRLLPDQGHMPSDALPPGCHGSAEPIVPSFIALTPLRPWCPQTEPSREYSAVDARHRPLWPHLHFTTTVSNIVVSLGTSASTRFDVSRRQTWEIRLMALTPAPWPESDTGGRHFGIALPSAKAGADRMIESELRHPGFPGGSHL